MESINHRSDIGRQLAELRQKQGLTQRDLAELCGINASNIAKIELGKYNASIDIIGRICDALGSRLQVIKKRQTVPDNIPETTERPLPSPIPG